MTDDARCAPAATRNREPILDVLRRHLPARGQVLEIASGTGEHIVHFAQSLPGLDFQPSDPDADARASIAAWTLALGLTNVRPPLALAVETGPWPVAYCDPTLLGGPANAGARAQPDRQIL